MGGESHIVQLSMLSQRGSFGAPWTCAADEGFMGVGKKRLRSEILAGGKANASHHRLHESEDGGDASSIALRSPLRKKCWRASQLKFRLKVERL